MLFLILTLIPPPVVFDSLASTFLKVELVISILSIENSFLALFPIFISIPAALLLTNSASSPEPSPISGVLDPSNTELFTTKLANWSA